jgi:hypothetical protein
MVEPHIRADIGPLLDTLAGLGYQVVASSYSPGNFGDWVVELAGPTAFRMFKDRSRFIVGGDRQALEPAGLWRAFEDPAEFSRVVLAWAAA